MELAGGVQEEDFDMDNKQVGLESPSSYFLVVYFGVLKVEPVATTLACLVAVALEELKGDLPEVSAAEPHNLLYEEEEEIVDSFVAVGELNKDDCGDGIELRILLDETPRQGFFDPLKQFPVRIHELQNFRSKLLKKSFSVEQSI
jgi:hypothetical protein